MTSMPPLFDLSEPLPEGRFVIEASAGTGKTYSLTGLVARYVADRGVRADQLLMVTFTRSAASDMRDRTRQQCRDYLTYLECAPVERGSGTAPWMSATLSSDEEVNARRAEHLRAFLSRYDEATITTIHGFCQLVLNRAGLLGPVSGDVSLVTDAHDIVDQVVSDLLIGPLSADPQLFDGVDDEGVSAKKVVDRLSASVKAALRNPSAQRIPLVPSNASRSSLSSLGAHERRAVIVHDIIEAIHRRRRAARVFGFDDLITSVDELLHGSAGLGIVQALRDHYRVVLVDEFQDTDAGQWSIFRRAFIEPVSGAGDVVVGTVGDPKQAIYRFRGADIDAYRAAVSDVTRTEELGTNFRSNARLIEAANALFAGVTFGSPSIVYRPVTPRAGHEGEGVLGHRSMEIRWVGYSPRAGAEHPKGKLRKAEVEALARGELDKWNLNDDDAMEIIYRDMAHEILDLIESGQIVDETGDSNKVRPGDIAVLVRGHGHADRIREVFETFGIPTVRYRTSSVFETPAALEWRILLNALASPSRMDLVRAASLTSFGQSSIDEILDQGPHRLDEWQQLCAQLSADLVTYGLSTVYFRLRSRPGFIERVMSRTDGERLLTDLDHIAEILLGLPDHGVGSGPGDFAQTLSELCQVSRGNDEEYQRRIDSDANAVHLATIHHSKGLEFPIVFLPTAMKMSVKVETPYVFSHDGQRVIDIASDVDWAWDDDQHVTLESRKTATRDDMIGDVMRMLYVAATRAQQKVVLYWTPVSGSFASMLGRLLFGRDGEDRPIIDAVIGVPIDAKKIDSNTGMAQALARVAGLDANIAVVEVDVDAVERQHAPRERRVADIGHAARFDRHELVRRPGWRKWSYSSLAHRLGTIQASHAEPFLPGADEGSQRVRVSELQAVSSIVSTTSQGSEVLFPDDLAGAAFGTAIHAIYEAIEPSESTLHDDIRRLVITQFGRRIDGDHVERLVRALEATCTSPLGPHVGGSTLAEIGKADRLAEVSFDMRMPHVAVTLGRIGEIISYHLDRDDPFHGYGRSLARHGRSTNVAGYMYGEIDAIIRLSRSPGSWSAVVADYKTNLLHEPGAVSPLDAYHPDRLANVMVEEHYMLQALIYQVALHRYLRWRVEDYRPEEQLGGIAYLFVRGMVGPDTPLTTNGDPMGVFSWTPPLDLIVALDAELSP